MRTLFFLLAGVVITAVTVGCSSDSQPVGHAANGSSEQIKSATVPHSHTATGPHSGTLVELGNDEYHAELVHDTNTVTVYILDGSATNTVAIDAQELVINILLDGKPEQFKLHAIQANNDSGGKSSQFAIDAGALAKNMDNHDAVAKLTVTINGTQYRGEIVHEHDGMEHEHADAH